MTFPDHRNDTGGLSVGAGPRDNAFPPDVTKVLNAAWGKAVTIRYREYLWYSADGLCPSSAEREYQQAAIAVIAERTGVSTKFIEGQLWGAVRAYAYGSGAYEEPDYLAPPVWEAFVADYLVRPHPQPAFDLTSAIYQLEARFDRKVVLDAAWREAVITQRYNPPDIDFVLSGITRKERHFAAVKFIVEQTGISTGLICRELFDRVEAYAHGRAADPDHFAPPDWEDLAVRCREQQIGIETSHHEEVLWGRLNDAPTRVQHQFWANQPAPDSPMISESQLVAAYRAVAQRSGIELILDPAHDDYGNPILAAGQGTIGRDGNFLWRSPLVGPAEAPTDAGQQGESLHGTVGTRPPNELASEHAPGPTSAVHRASATFFDSRATPGTTPCPTVSPPGGSGIGPSPHPGVAPGESPRSGRMR